MAKRRAVTREIRNSLKQIQNLENLSAKEFLKVVDEWRERVILTIIEVGDLNPITSDVIKAKVVELNDQFKLKFESQLTENQRRLFVKGIQIVDNALKSGDIQTAIPFLSENKLELLKKYGAEHITNLTDTARNRIAQEVDLAVLGQKSQTDLLNAIGRNLKDPSVFGTIAKRAEVILKTEVNRINQIAAADRLKQSATQVKDLRKQWIHSHVGIPRPGHFDLDRVVVYADEKFELEGADGRLYLVDGPMDPILPVGEVVNCKCKVVPVVERFQRRDATGAAGRTRTPNQMAKDMGQQVKQFWEGNEREHAIIYDDKGGVILSKTGSSKSVSFTTKQLLSMKNKRMIHNHPEGASLSPADLAVAADHGLKEMVAFGPEYTYVARPKRGKWPEALRNQLQVEFDFQIARKGMSKKYYQTFLELSKSMTRAGAELEAWRRLTNGIMEQLSSKYGFIYERRKGI